jgi:formimidoylglutamate deiminase
MEIVAKAALLPDGWAEGVAVRVGPDGRIAAVETGRAGGRGVLIPALSNLHSHSFQRAMAGLTEHRADGHDNFWSWRSLMYRFLDRMTPGQVEAVARLAFMEMLEAGYAAVAEFHYLHHQPGGAPYDDPAELSARICAAAADTGIGLTLLPVLYAQGGADGRALAGGQRRFRNDLDGFLRLFDGARAHAARLPADTVLGVAPHSLRAASPAQIAGTLDAVPAGPVHIHAAEQAGEVAEIKAALGARPVAWLLDNAAIDERWCLIHCTQMTPGETLRLAASGAVAGLCPVTEANLGDGIFDGPRFIGAGGRLGVGSDSCVRITVSGELSALEYSQRLRDRARNVMGTAEGSVGAGLYRRALAGGAQALGRASGAIAPGLWADLVRLDDMALPLAGRAGDRLLDAWVFGADDRVVSDVWSAGRATVQGGRHVARERIEAEARTVLAALAGD